MHLIRYFGPTLLLLAGLLSLSDTHATGLDLMSVDIHGAKLGMNLEEAVAVFVKQGYKRDSKSSLSRKDKDGTRYVGLKLNRSGQVIYIGVSHWVIKGYDPDSAYAEWTKHWGKPDREDPPQPGFSYRVWYESDAAELKADALGGGSGKGSVSVTLASKGQALAARRDERGQKMPAKFCKNVKEKPLSTLSVEDRDILMECIRTGQLRICDP